MSGLEISQDLDQEHTEWALQRISWVVAGAILLAGALGLLGAGVLSTTSVADPSGTLSVDYERVVRREAPTTLKIRVDAGPAPRSVGVWLSADYVANIEITRIDPVPVSSEASGDRVVYRMNAAGPFDVHVHLEPSGYGRTPVRVGTLDGPTVGFQQLVLP